MADSKPKSTPPKLFKKARFRDYRERHVARLKSVSNPVVALNPLANSTSKSRQDVEYSSTESPEFYGNIDPAQLKQIQSSFQFGSLDKRRRLDADTRETMRGELQRNEKIIVTKRVVQSRELLVSSPLGILPGLRKEGAFYIFESYEKSALAIKGMSQKRVYTISENAACSSSPRLYTALEAKRKPRKAWDEVDEIMWDYKSAKTSKKFAGEPFDGIILYWDKYVEWCILKNYKPEIIARFKGTTDWIQWRGLGIWIRWAGRSHGNVVIDFSYERIPADVRQAALDVGELLCVEPVYLQKLRDGQTAPPKGA